jgi:hypothetical protein
MPDSLFNARENLPMLSLHQSCCNQQYLTFSFSGNYFGVIFTEFSSGVTAKHQFAIGVRGESGR